MRDRADFIENITAARIHLLICLEDIKYPLSEHLQECLEAAEQLVGAIIRDLMKQDIEAAKAKLEAQHEQD